MRNAAAPPCSLAPVAVVLLLGGCFSEHARDNPFDPANASKDFDGDGVRNDDDDFPLDGACSVRDDSSCSECGVGCTAPRLCDGVGACICPDPKHTGVDCATCMDPRRRGADCEDCADRRYAAPDCTSCLPRYAGVSCGECADPRFTGAGCDECADLRLTGASCDECVDPGSTPPLCEPCVPSCADKERCDDGCGGTCGECAQIAEANDCALTECGQSTEGQCGERWACYAECMGAGFSICMSFVPWEWCKTGPNWSPGQPECATAVPHTGNPVGACAAADCQCYDDCRDAHPDCSVTPECVDGCCNDAFE